MKTTAELGAFLHENHLYVLFDGKTFGDEYKVCIKETYPIIGTSIWTFGRVYHVYADKYVFDEQGCKSFDNKYDAIKAACKFFGVEDDFFD